MSGVNAFFNSSGIAATRRTFQRDSAIFHQDEPNPFFYFIEAGEVVLSRVDSGGNEIVFISSTGERIGTLMDKEMLTAKTRGAGATMLVVSKAEFARAIAVSDTLVIKYLLDLEEKTIENTLRLLWGKNTSVKKTNCAKRVINNILLLMINNQAEKAGRDFLLYMTQEDLAHLAGVARETVSRVLTKFLPGYRGSKNGVLRLSQAGFQKMLNEEGRADLLAYKQWKDRVEASLPPLNTPGITPEPKARRKLASITKLLEILNKPL